MDPNDAQLRVQSELQSGESLSWSGTADPRRAALAALPVMAIGLPFAGFALFWMSMAFHTTHAMNSAAHNHVTRGFSALPFFGVPFLLVGMATVLAPLWAFLKAKSTIYAVTNHRVMILTGSNGQKVKSLMPADILSVEHRERPDGSGDITLMTNQLVRTGNNMSSQMRVALCGVPNVKQVANQVMNLQMRTQASPA